VSEKQLIFSWFAGMSNRESHSSLRSVSVLIPDSFLLTPSTRIVNEKNHAS